MQVEVEVGDLRADLGDCYTTTRWICNEGVSTELRRDLYVKKARNERFE
jgi:hypothetical protein